MCRESPPPFVKKYHPQESFCVDLIVGFLLPFLLARLNPSSRLLGVLPLIKWLTKLNPNRRETVASESVSVHLSSTLESTPPPFYSWTWTPTCEIGWILLTSLTTFVEQSSLTRMMLMGPRTCQIINRFTCADMVIDALNDLDQWQ